MRIDLFTKVILTIIALLLAVIALRPVFQPRPVMAQGSLNGVQFSTTGGYLLAIDPRTGDIWEYWIGGTGGGFVEGGMTKHLKITQLGKPLSH
jgi:hypothetical protein